MSNALGSRYSDLNVGEFLNYEPDWLARLRVEYIRLGTHRDPVLKRNPRFANGLAGLAIPQRHGHTPAIHPKCPLKLNRLRRPDGSSVGVCDCITHPRYMLEALRGG
jgi:hypothetical protein